MKNESMACRQKKNRKLLQNIPSDVLPKLVLKFFVNHIIDPIRPKHLPLHSEKKPDMSSLKMNLFCSLLNTVHPQVVFLKIFFFYFDIAHPISAFLSTWLTLFFPFFFPNICPKMYCYYFSTFQWTYLEKTLKNTNFFVIKFYIWRFEI